MHDIRPGCQPCVIRLQWRDDESECGAEYVHTLLPGSIVDGEVPKLYDKAKRGNKYISIRTSFKSPSCFPPVFDMYIYDEKT